MAKSLTEYLNAREERRQALLNGALSKEQLLEQLRQTLRGIRESLPPYRRVQEPARYNMTVEDIADHEQLYAQLKADRSGIHDLEDYAEALLNAQDTSAVITHILSTYGTSSRTATVMNKQRSTWWLIAAAAAIFLIARSCASQ